LGAKITYCRRNVTSDNAEPRLHKPSPPFRNNPQKDAKGPNLQAPTFSHQQNQKVPMGKVFQQRKLSCLDY